MATSERMKSIAIHFEKFAYGGAGLLAVIVFLIPFLSTRDLVDGYVATDKAKDNFIEKAKGEDRRPPPPPVKKTLEEQWSVSEVPSPWVSPWTTEVKPQMIKIKATVKAMSLVHEAANVTKITTVRDPKKLKVFLKIEGTRGKLDQGSWKSAKLQRKVIEPPPGTGSDFGDIKDFGADQEIKYDDLDVKPSSTYIYRLVTEVAPKEGVEVKDPPDLTKTSNELPLVKVIPWEYRVRIISATGFDAKTGAEASLNGEVFFWDYEKVKVAQLPATVWKEKVGVFGPKVNGTERYQIWQIEDGKVTILDRVSNKKEVLSTKENKRDVDLPPVMTPETAAAAAAPPPDETKTKKDAKAAAKAKAAADEDEKPVKKKETSKKPDTKKKKK